MSGWHRDSRHARGYGTEWDRLRIIVLNRDCGLCQCSECKRTGRIRMAHEVDHVIPRSKGGTDDMDNLQAINRECHRDKSLRDKGIKPRPQIGIDGYPIGE